VKQKSTLLIIAIVCLLNIQAQRNYKFENFGNRSILLNGNVTGSVDDLGATYYNPARLALVEDPVFLINAKIYQLSNVKIGNITIDGKSLSQSNFDGLPSMIAGSFKIKKFEGHHFAYAVFSRNRSDLSIGYNSNIIDVIDPDFDLPIEKYVASTNITNKLRDNWFGVSWATSINENFSIGASLFGSIYKYETGYTQKFNSINNLDEVGSYDSSVNFKQTSYGLYGKIGAAWTLEKFNLGVNIDLPYLELYGKGDFRYEEYLTGIDDIGDVFTYNNYDKLDSKRKYPLGISVGSGIPVKKHILHLNVSWNAKVNNYSKIDIPPLQSETEDDLPSLVFDEELKSIVNFGVGAEIYYSEKLNFYGSLSSDYSPYRSVTNYNDQDNELNEVINLSTNYFHYGAGVNVHHKWANFVLGTIYSNGKSTIKKPIDLPSDTSGSSNEFSDIKFNRWRFVIGLEILFMDKTLNKYKLDNRLF